MFPDDWDDPQRFNEELAVAFTRKIFINGTRDQWQCKLASGRVCIICINDNTATHDATTIIKNGLAC